MILRRKPIALTYTPPQGLEHDGAEGAQQAEPPPPKQECTYGIETESRISNCNFYHHHKRKKYVAYSMSFHSRSLLFNIQYIHLRRVYYVKLR